MTIADAPRDYSPGLLVGGDRATFPLLRYVINELRPAGFALEFGVAEGTSLGIIAEHMWAVGFDSFKGLPEEWGPYPEGARACPRPYVQGARIVEGMFADTLPEFDFDTVDPIGLVHVDCDLYSSTKTLLEWVGPHINPGCYIVFDEWRGAGWYEPHEQKAWREYTEEHPIGWSVIGHDSEAWAIRIEAV